MNIEINWFFNKNSNWQSEYNELRLIVLNSGLVEELKWGCPCYSFKGNKVVLIHGFKDYCALLFIKGALLKDPYNILVQQTRNVQAARQIRFKGIQEIVILKPSIEDYIMEAIELEKAGKSVEMKSTKDFEIAPEFQIILNEMPEIKVAFDGLTPGRQRGYLLYFSSAKQSKTRESRIEKCIDKIRRGKGLED